MMELNAAYCLPEWKIENNLNTIILTSEQQTTTTDRIYNHYVYNHSATMAFKNNSKNNI